MSRNEKQVVFRVLIRSIAIRRAVY